MDPLEALVLQVLDQLEWQHPWAFVLLPLPIVMALLPPYRERRDAVRVPFSSACWLPQKHEPSAEPCC